MYVVETQATIATTWKASLPREGKGAAAMRGFSTGAVSGARSRVTFLQRRA
jgi:hypothetical protein